MILILVLAARKIKYTFVCVCFMFEICKTCRNLKFNESGIYPVKVNYLNGMPKGTIMVDISHHAEAEMTSYEETYLILFV